MKESIAQLKVKVNKVKESSSLTGKDLLLEILTHFLFTFCSFFSSNFAVVGKYLPFGISAAAGCPHKFLPAAALGSIIGYFFPVTGTSGFRYIAGILSVMAIRLLTSKIKFTKENPFFTSFIAFLSVFLTGVMALKALSGGVAFAFVEALFSAGATYFMSKASKDITLSGVGLSTEEMTSFIITLSIILSGINIISFEGIALGRIIFVFFILVASRSSGAGMGAVLGVVASLSCALSSSNLSVAVMLSFGGLLSGVFAEIGKIAETLSFLAAALIGAIIGNFSAESIAVIIESLLGCALFILIPKSALRHIGKVFAGRTAVIRPEGLKKALTMRLKFASDALKDVSGTVENVSSELSRINSPDFKNVLSKIEADACKGCSMQIFCWETKYDETLAAILSMTKAVKRGETAIEKSADENFLGRCNRVNKLTGATYKYYSEYASSISAEKRIEEVRSVVTDQFSGISNMLSSLAKEFEADEKYDTAAADRIASALKNIDIVVSECGVKIDKYDRMTVDMCVKNAKNVVFNRADIMRALCVACDRDFDPPTITHSAGDAYLCAGEHARLTADIGVNQIGSGGNVVCGDRYEYFFDGRGRLFMIISDGMGTGGRAAVDSAMSCGLMSRLLKSGFDFDSALKIINSSMLFKSTDESTATVDIVCLDLFTGKTELLKAGAAPTIVRRSGRAGKAQSTSLPIGILSGISFDKAVITVKKGDIILMMSDGAVNDSTDWISAEIESWSDGSAQALADRISNCAARRRGREREDDITVMAAIIKSA